MNKFAERFRELRTEGGYTAKQISEKLSVSPRLISYWENGQRECDFNMLLKIAQTFSVSTDYLLGNTDY